jgi:stage III sporulation protein AG
MKKFFSQLKEKKNIHMYVWVFLTAGVLLMLIGRWQPGTPRPSSPQPYGYHDNSPSAGPIADENNFNAERELEKRLEEAFSMVEDVGRVRVLLSFTPDKETVYASDASISESYTREVDSQGGSREVRSVSNQGKTIIITDRAGVDRPLVLREIEPKIAGAVIIAEGGDSVFVKDALTKAACTVLGIEANKVQVLKMSP